ncbi:ABC transporter permease subunit [Thermosediminibacter litoriperuensis]|uniref:Monosaccharide ABC transporter membrane protein, CUT2 family (TC 3.A.1.2.-) n=1 Tax=Thermosediminibacter litoriperuensis TaxID=291989 RepID=A0A5S5AX90_9FIRM|nr:ABC transporter permease [Thermosediminibacter litoriperuensis]TYP58487.1 monosaccharide ABC transporter membrane protein, CUT2 family (TC 3.A.1.2.-) [Thermosediminibacter litoriperuensis]
MKNLWKKLIDKYGYPKVFITILLAILLLIAVFQKQSIYGLLKDSLVRIGMNSVLVLAMVPSIVSGTGLNFALSIGIICGLLAGCITIEMNMVGLKGFLIAVLISIPFSVVAGYLYSILLNRVKGDEMTVGTYMGFSVVSLMCIGWLLLPFKNPEMVWAIGGKGLRTTITLANKYDKVLDRLIKLPNIDLPIGTLLFFALCSLLMWLFLRSKTGIAMMAAGSNPRFAQASGINVDLQRTIGTILSMVLGGIGILVYAQSYGFYQLYIGPLMMPFAAISAILIGGATAKKASISNVIAGVVLFQALLTISLPVINRMMPEGNLSEVVRIIVSNGVILYALTKVGGND